MGGWEILGKFLGGAPRKSVAFPPIPRCQNNNNTTETTVRRSKDAAHGRRLSRNAAASDSQATRLITRRSSASATEYVRRLVTHVLPDCRTTTHWTPSNDPRCPDSSRTITHGSAVTRPGSTNHDASIGRGPASITGSASAAHHPGTTGTSTVTGTDAQPAHDTATTAISLRISRPAIVPHTTSRPSAAAVTGARVAGTGRPRGQRYSTRRSPERSRNTRSLTALP